MVETNKQEHQRSIFFKSPDVGDLNKDVKKKFEFYLIAF